VDILTSQVRLAGEDALMGAKRKRYTPAYRRDAARLVIDSGRTIVEVASEIGVGPQLLGRWVAVERAAMDDPPGALDIDERAELERLRAENSQLRMDREFLKKAAAFFVAENGSSPPGRSS
jgi:transposase